MDGDFQIFREYMSTNNFSKLQFDFLSFMFGFKYNKLENKAVCENIFSTLYRWHVVLLEEIQKEYKQRESYKASSKKSDFFLSNLWWFFES